MNIPDVKQTVDLKGDYVTIANKVIIYIFQFSLDFLSGKTTNGLPE